MKEFWIEEYDRLSDELEREPTGREVEIAVGDRLGDIADRAKDAWKDAQKI
jgi:hypothetical protein